MYDQPTPEELLAAVSRYLRDDAGPALGASGPQAHGAALAYQARVAANMLDMVRRQGLLPRWPRRPLGACAAQAVDGRPPRAGDLAYVCRAALASFYLNGHDAGRP